MINIESLNLFWTPIFDASDFVLLVVYDYDWQVTSISNYTGRVLVDQVFGSKNFNVLIKLLNQLDNQPLNTIISKTGSLLNHDYYPLTFCPNQLSQIHAIYNYTLWIYGEPSNQLTIINIGLKSLSLLDMEYNNLVEI